MTPIELAVLDRSCNRPRHANDTVVPEAIGLIAVL